MAIETKSVNNIVFMKKLQYFVINQWNFDLTISTMHWLDIRHNWLMLAGINSPSFIESTHCQLIIKIHNEFYLKQSKSMNVCILRKRNKLQARAQFMVKGGMAWNFYINFFIRKKPVAHCHHKGRRQILKKQDWKTFWLAKNLKIRRPHQNR